MRTLSKAWIIRNILGLVVLVANSYWLIDTIDTYNKYQVKDILYVLIVPDWILLLTSITALIGIVIGWKILNGSISRIFKWVLVDLSLFILMITVDWVYQL